MPLQFPRLKTTKKPDIAYTSVMAEYKPGSGAPRSERWPSSPRRVTVSTWSVLGDILLLAPPTAFIILAFLALKLNGQPLSRHGERVVSASFLGPTVFPLVFAALTGRAMRKIALWKAEKGTSLGVLEHLVGSSSLVSTLGQAIMLRSFTFLTLVLCVLWALSPLGGQSALRLISETNSTKTEVHPVFFADVDAPSGYMLNSANPDIKPAFCESNNAVLYMSLLTAKTLEKSEVDAWQHPKVPRVADLERSDLNKTELNWVDIDRGSEQNYASLNGIPIMNLRPDSDTNFTIPYEYLYFDCKVKMGLEQETNGSRAFQTEEEIFNYLRDLGSNLEGPEKVLVEPPDVRTPFVRTPLFQLNQSTYHTMWNATNDAYPSYASTFFIFGTRSGGKNSTEGPADTLLFGSKNQLISGNPGAVLYTCSMDSILLDVNVGCRSNECSVHRLRRNTTIRTNRAKFPLGYSTWSGLPYDVIHDPITSTYFLEYIKTVAPTAVRPHPIDSYIYNATSWKESGFASSVYSPHRWEKISTIDISNRLTRILNTYWDASRWQALTSRNDFYTPPQLLNFTRRAGYPLELGYPDNDYQGFSRAAMPQADAVRSWQIPRYKANIRWIIILIFCSLVPLALSIASLVLQFTTNIPDIFGYVSSLARDNPFIDTSATIGGSTLTGSERARLLKDLQVQVGDVEEERSIGYIAFRSVDSNESKETFRVRKGRLYR